MSINQNQVENLLSQIPKEYKRIRSERSSKAEIVAHEFNVFNEFFRLGENKTSEILAFFLDPKRSHGQKEKYLNSFLRFIKFSPMGLDLTKAEVTVVCEHPIKVKKSNKEIKNRRIDIFIKIKYLDELFLVAIENKIWAKDQDNQLKDYHEYLEGLLPKPEAFLLLYLNPYGQKPSIASITPEKLKDNEGTIKIKDYQSDLLTELKKWVDQTEAPIIVELLTDLIRYFDQEINDNFIMGNESAELAKTINKPEQIRAAFQIYYAHDELKKLLFLNFVKQLCAAIPEELELLSSPDLPIQGNELLFKFKNDNSKRFYLAIAFGDIDDVDNKHRIEYGIRIKDEFINKTICSLIVTKEINNLGRAKRSQHWPWYACLSDHKWSMEDYANPINNLNDYATKMKDLFDATSAINI